MIIPFNVHTRWKKAIDSDLLTKNVAKQLNTVISKEDKKERRVLTVSEAELFLGEAPTETICKPYIESETLSVTGCRPIISKLPQPLEMQAFHGFVNLGMARLVA